MRIAPFLVLLTAVVACTDEPPVSPPAPPPTADVVQATPAIVFQPQQVRVRTNGAITWEFGVVPHNVTFAATPGRPADIAGFNTNTSIARTFTTAGTFAYECTIHPGMRGSVVVTLDDPSSPYPLAADLRRCARAVRSEHDVRVEHREEGREITATRGGQVGLDEGSVAGAIDVRSRRRSLHPAACGGRAAVPRRGCVPRWARSRRRAP